MIIRGSIVLVVKIDIVSVNLSMHGESHRRHNPRRRWSSLKRPRWGWLFIMISKYALYRFAIWPNYNLREFRMTWKYSRDILGNYKITDELLIWIYIAIQPTGFFISGIAHRRNNCSCCVYSCRIAIFSYAPFPNRPKAVAALTSNSFSDSSWHLPQRGISSARI